MKNVFIVLGTGTLCVSQWVQSSYFSDTISALTKRDWVVLQGNHAIKLTLIVRK